MLFESGGRRDEHGLSVLFYEFFMGGCIGMRFRLVDGWEGAVEGFWEGKKGEMAAYWELFWVLTCFWGNEKNRKEWGWIGKMG